MCFRGAIATQNPGLITKFGGHAMAAGLSITREKYADFSAVFAKEIAQAQPSSPKLF